MKLKSAAAKTVLFLLVFTAGVLIAQAVYAGPGNSGPGSEMDPLAARSYLEQELQQRDREITNQIQQLQQRIQDLKTEIKNIEASM